MNDSHTTELCVELCYREKNGRKKTTRSLMCKCCYMDVQSIRRLLRWYEWKRWITVKCRQNFTFTSAKAKISITFSERHACIHRCVVKLNELRRIGTESSNAWMMCLCLYYECARGIDHHYAHTHVHSTIYTQYKM